MQKGACPNEYMGDWEKYNETSFTEKEDFDSHFNMEDIPSWCRLCPHKKILQRFWNKKFRRISWFLCSSDTLLLANVFENFRNMCLKINKLNPAKNFSGSELAWQAALKLVKGV